MLNIFVNNPDTSHTRLHLVFFIDFIGYDIVNATSIVSNDALALRVNIISIYFMDRFVNLLVSVVP